MTEPKLLTEAQAIEMWNQAQKSAPATFIEIFRERGLIAEEPVDPLLVEARQIIADTCDTHESKGQWLDGVWDDEQEMAIALAALHRGMELGRSDRCEAIATAPLIAALEEAREALEGIVTDAEDDPCWRDHHGYCQAHGLNDPCEMAIARQVLTRITETLAKHSKEALQ